MMEFPTAPWWFLLLVLACCMGIVWVIARLLFRDKPNENGYPIDEPLDDNLYPKDE